MTANQIVILFIAGAIGSAIGSLPRGGSPWKGPIAFAVVFAASAAQGHFMPDVGPVVGFIAALVIFGVIGGALRMTSIQLTASFLGAALFVIGAMVVIQPAAA